MQKSYIFFGLAALALAFYAIEQYDNNTVCHEVKDSYTVRGLRLGPMLVDKCKGQTYILVKNDIDKDENGEKGWYSYRWTTIKFEEYSEPIWKDAK